MTFPEGSIGPKVAAACHFAEVTGVSPRSGHRFRRAHVAWWGGHRSAGVSQRRGL